MLNKRSERLGAGALEEKGQVLYFGALPDLLRLWCEGTARGQLLSGSCVGACPLPCCEAETAESSLEPGAAAKSRVLGALCW